MMDVANRNLLANENLRKLLLNSYPGRGIVVGMDQNGNLIQIYWIQGRSPSSRNRVFEEGEKGVVRTSAADRTVDMGDTSLIFYRAMAERGGMYVVSNGDQTDTIIEYDSDGHTFFQALRTRQYEPDAPNYTPRISAACFLRRSGPSAEISILKRSLFGEGTDRDLYRYEEFQRGYGYCVHTYMDDGDPLPSFEGRPYLIPITGGGIGDIAENLWPALHSPHMVALVVKQIDVSTGKSAIHIKNKYKVVEAAAV